MSAEDCIKAGDLAGALKLLQETIRESPDSARHRVFLFQLLAVQSNWDRALTQLNVAADIDPSTLLMAQACRELLQNEGFRSKVFAGSKAPLLFGEPASWVGTLIQALLPAANNDGEQALRVASEAFDQAPTSAGTIDDQPFEWISDADMRLGPVLEAVVNGRYYWIPFFNIAEIEFQPPEDLRDLVWIPAQFTWRNEGQAVGFIPSRYPDSTADDQLALARKTEWHDRGGEFFTGTGQRVFSTDAGDYPILETRRIVINHDKSSDVAAE